jgi:hypothetical protein
MNKTSQVGVETGEKKRIGKLKKAETGGLI